MWTLVFLSNPGALTCVADKLNSLSATQATCALDLRGSVGFFCRGILRLSSIIFNSPFEFDVGLTRSLFILYVHEHDRLGFGMLTVETAVIHFLFILIVPITTEKVSHIRSNIIWNRWKSTLRARSIPE